MLVTVTGRAVRPWGTDDTPLPASGVVQFEALATGVLDGALRSRETVCARIADGSMEAVELAPGPWRVYVYPDKGRAWDSWIIELDEADEPVDLATLAPVVVIDGEKWAQGDPGPAGASVTDAREVDGALVLTLSDGTETAPVPIPPGPAGVGIASISDPDTDSRVTITYTDGSTSTVQAIAGAPGDDGHTPVIGWDGTALVIDGETGPDLKGEPGDGEGLGVQIGGEKPTRGWWLDIEGGTAPPDPEPDPDPDPDPEPDDVITSDAFTGSGGAGGRPTDTAYGGEPVTPTATRYVFTVAGGTLRSNGAGRLLYPLATEYPDVRISLRPHAGAAEWCLRLRGEAGDLTDVNVYFTNTSGGGANVPSRIRSTGFAVGVGPVIGQGDFPDGYADGALIEPDRPLTITLTGHTISIEQGGAEVLTVAGLPVGAGEYHAVSTYSGTSQQTILSELIFERVAT